MQFPKISDMIVISKENNCFAYAKMKGKGYGCYNG